jgi:biotin/methionine sulfoxide reductase
VQELLAFEHDCDPSPIGPGIIDVQHGPTRVDAPMVRESWLTGGPGTRTDLRGSDPFVEVSWDKVNELVAKELNRVRKSFGNASIFGGSYGWASAGRFHHAQSHLKRFLNCIGGFTRSKFTYSFAAAEAMVPHVLGSFRDYLDTCTSWDVIRDHTQLFVCFGGVPLKNGQISQGGTGCHIQRRALLDAGKAGIDFVNISPMKSDFMDDVGSDWLALRPNTDVALMLGLAHTLESEGLTDQAFLQRYTEGFEAFLPYLMGETDGTPKTADWAAGICEIPADTIRELAQRMAKMRTMISVSWSLTRQDHGEQPFWMAITLAAMLGQIGLPGGGFGFGYSAMNFIGGNHHIIPGASLPQGKNPIEDFIPVARITDLLLNPGKSFDFDGVRYEYPNTKLVWWAGGNPFHHHQDLNLMMRAWQKPETVIVNEWCWNPLAKHADIVLPCTTSLERDDMAITPRDPYVVSMSKLTEPFGQARDDYDIFAGIACAMGVEDEFTQGRSTHQWQRWIYDKTKERCADVGLVIPTFDQFRSQQWFKLEDLAKSIIMLSDFRADPVAHPLATPSGKIEIFSRTVEDFGYEDCPGHPVWQEPYEWLGNVDCYPLHLISNQPKDKLHSQLDHGSVSKSKKIAGREPLHIQPEDAALRGLKNGDLVRVFNDRGACLGSVVIDAAMRSGVVQMSTGSWYDPDETGMCKHGNPNVLTRDKGTSKLGQGPSAHSCLIEVELFKDAPPPLTAHEPPQIIRSETSKTTEVQT